MLYVGVDLGTSAVKMLLMRNDGKIEKIVSKEYPLSFPHPGWSEQKPEDWWTQVMAGLKELLSECDKSQVAGISFGGQMHGLVILDKDDNVIRPAILWNDGRTTKETEYLNNVIGKDKLSQYTANIAFAGFTAPKILWVKENEPENFAKIAKIMLPKDYIAYKLSGVHCTDVSDASGMLLFDVKNKCWSKEMMEICSVKEEQLAKIFESYEVVGCVKEEIAKELGIPADCKVVAGAGDNAAAAIGTGTVGDAMCNISLGTSGTIFISSKEFTVDDNNALHAFAHSDGAMFIGMSMDTTRADMTQAVLEGVCFGIRDSFEVAKAQGINITKTKICGGGAKSPLWKKMMANVLGIPVQEIESEEGPGYGGAILAAVGCKEFASVEEAAEKLVKVVGEVTPDKELTAKYEEKYQKFRKLYPAVKELF